MLVTLLPMMTLAKAWQEWMVHLVVLGWSKVAGHPAGEASHQLAR